MKKNLTVLTFGFALFSMFFGSGNLVFPLQVGKENPGNVLESTLGILLSGVIVPFLGVFGMILYGGELPKFFRCFGKWGLFLFSFASLALMGPFGVLARCLTVAHGALLLLVPNLPLLETSLVLCLLLFALTYNKQKIVGLLGTYLTPFLLLAIILIAAFGLSVDQGERIASENSLSSFLSGFFQGYQTMDLLAAFFFSTFVFSQVKEQHENAAPLFLRSSLVGGTLLSLVYFLMVWLGALHSQNLAETPPQEMFGKVALLTLGSFAAPVVAIAIMLACLTTAVVLTTLFADFLRKECTQNKISHGSSLFITLLIGFLVSTLDFSGIARFLAPILETIYPGLIVLTLINIGLFFRRKKVRLKTETQGI